MITNLAFNFFKLSNLMFTLVLMLLVILKNGVHPIGTDWISWIYKASENFPEPTSYLSNSVIPIFIAEVLGYPSYLVWWIVFLFFTILFYSFLFIRLNSLFRTNYKIALLVFMAFPFTITPLYYLGHYDLLTLFGALLAGLTRSKGLVLLGSGLAIGANPEQALITSLCVGIFSIGTRSKWHKFIAVVWSAGSIFTLGALNFFVGKSSSGNRIEVIRDEFTYVSIESIGQSHLLIFSIFSSGWIVIFLTMLRENSKFHNYSIFIGVILIPIILTIFILDHTRVGIAVGTLPLLLFLKHYIDSNFLHSLNQRFSPPNFLFYIVLFTPSLIVDSDGSLRMPYIELFKLLMG